ncbi:peptidylprolyl isomerase [Herbidospora galbida]|uniref:Peptidylprolyl isomerase n=1 Tax=Herbidospora galbida TaxID=2575442 RepID=A0A4U3M6K5_9ACTN|nr:peptidylprolyl isomerase [Herbidospora galbida]TKK83584.1 peptidylprolyl isomerase [Herbidospora galbida]
MTHTNRQKPLALGQARRVRLGVGAVILSLFAVTGCSSADSNTAAQGEETPPPSAAPSITSIPSTLPDQPTAPPTPVDPRTVKCEYRKDDSGAPAKFVGMPPAKPVKAALNAKNMTIKTNQGDIVIELVPASTPCTVNSFYFLAQKNYFDNTVCHRLTNLESNGLDLLQCGDPQAKGDGKNKSDGTGGPGYLFPDENLGPAYTRGVVFMAQGGDAANSNGSQFAISYSDEAAQLPAAYTPFGVVTKGMEVVDKIAKEGVIKNEDDILADDGGSNAPKMRVEIKNVVIR